MKYEEDDPAHFRFALGILNSIDTWIFRFVPAIADSCLHFLIRKSGYETPVVSVQGARVRRLEFTINNHTVVLCRPTFYATQASEKVKSSLWLRA